MAAAVLATAVAAGVLSAAPAATAATAEPSYGRHLLVADTAEERIYAYRLSDMRRTGQLEGIVPATHAGTVVLPDGRVLLVDDAHAQVLVLVIDDRGRPTVQERIVIPGDRPWEGALWAGVDPGANYFALTSGYDDSAEQTVTVVDLFDYSVGQLPVTLTANDEGGYDELHVWLAGQPLQVTVTTGGELRSYPLSAVMAGRTPRPSSSAPAGPGTHGPVLSRDGDRLFVTTTEGVDRVRIHGSRLRDHRTLPYPASPPLVQNYRPRLSQDGTTLFGPIAEDVTLPEGQWARTPNWLHTLDTTSETSAVHPLAQGIVGRSAASRQYALFPVLGARRDTAVLVDMDRSSSTFASVLHRVPLRRLSEGPRPGASIAGTERRSAAITTSGDRAFVSHGGDGLISVIDTARGKVVRTVRTPTDLSGGGYLVAVERGRPLVDVMAR